MSQGVALPRGAQEKKGTGEKKPASKIEKKHSFAQVVVRPRRTKDKKRGKKKYGQRGLSQSEDNVT